jgi:hypothetical protein
MLLGLLIGKVKFFFSKVQQYLLPILRIQLFITLVALPILVYWGLAVSSLTIFGNIIFTPLLTAFLLISSLIFFFELFYIPNYWLIYLLEKLTCLWLKISPPCPKAWLLFFPQTTCILFLGAFLLTIYAINLRINLIKQLLLLSLILLTSLFIAKLNFWIRLDQIALKHRKTKLQIFYQPSGTLVIYDYGIMNQRYGIQNWLCYKLLPALIKNFGTLTVSDLYLSKSNQFTKTNVELLQQNLDIKNVHYK